MFLTKLAFKNLVRHRNRTLITAVIIAFAVFAFLVMDSLIGGMTEMSYDSIIDYEAGHLQIVNESYWKEKDDLPLEDLMADNQQIVHLMEQNDYYKSSSVELNFTTRLNNGSNELPVAAKGIKPEMFNSVFDFNDQFVEGEMFSAGENKVVMGKRLADLMKVKKDDYITLLFKDKNETLNTVSAQISGLIHTGSPNVNRNIVYLPLDTAQKALNLDNSISKIIVRLEDKNMAQSIEPSLEQQLKKTNKNLGVYHWEELEAVSVAGAKNAANQMIMVIILMIAAIAIINTVILGALERMKEIGMMKAMGLSRKEIIYTFVLESTGIGLLGGIIGIALGFFGVYLMSIYGIDFGALTNIDMSSFGIPVIGKLYGVWNPKSFVLVFSFGVIVSLLASILPAYWAANKDPVDAIYYR